MSSRLKGDFRKFMDKNFLGAWDVPEGEDLVLTIDHAEQNEVKNERGSSRKLTLHFVENYKPMILNTTNATSIGDLYGSKKVEDWEGKKVAIFTDKVTAFGGTTDALRIRPYMPRETEAICEQCNQAITKHNDYSVNKIVTLSMSKYGRRLCWDCCMKEKEARNNESSI